jgi:hypothetical protein
MGEVYRARGTRLDSILIRHLIPDRRFELSVTVPVVSALATCPKPPTPGPPVRNRPVRPR